MITFLECQDFNHNCKATKQSKPTATGKSHVVKVLIFRDFFFFELVC